MKKTLLLISAAAAVLYASAQAPVAQWGNILDSSTAGDQASAIAIGANNDVYWLTTMGSTEASPVVSLNQTPLFEGEPYNSGNSYANNLCLLATDNAGAEKWVIYSNLGDFASGQGSVVVDADGNVIFTAKLRNGDDLSKPINIVDASGVSTQIGTPVEKRSYNLLVAKASAEGQLIWHKYITMSTVPGAAATTDFIADAVKTSGLAVDGNGNIYVGGNFSADMYIGDVTLNPTNVAEWNGNSQTASGTMYILKFDADGNYITSAIGSEGVKTSQITNIEYSGDSLYILGNAQGEASLSFADCAVTPSEYQSLVAGCLSTDLKAQWLKCIPGTAIDGTCTIQNSGLTIAGKTMWIAGMFNGTFSDGADKSVSSAAKTPREGLIIKIDATDGSWLAATSTHQSEFTPAAAKTTLQGYFKILQNPAKPAKCYAYGYVMNANVGVILREYDANTLEANVDHTWSLATGGGVPTCSAIALNSTTGTAYITARGNKAFSLLADPAIETIAPANWGVLIAAYDVPDDLKQGQSGISLPTTSEGEALLFNLQGMRVNADSLAPGVYIRRQGNVSSKLIVR